MVTLRAWKSIAVSILVAAAVAATYSRVQAQSTAPVHAVLPKLGSLAKVRTPLPPNLEDFVHNKNAAVAFGKALFWDMQAGSEGIQSCATCHFNAGADSRSKNQVGPGINAHDSTFSQLAGGFGGGPNYQLHLSDFPFHSGPQDQTAVGDTNDVVSSQGVLLSGFVGVVPARSWDESTPQSDAAFNVGGVTTRRVEPRNTPTVINSAFNYRNFWDGRAQNECNGVNPFGERDLATHLYKAKKILSTPQAVHVRMINASTCSQALGPPLSPFEMSADGRSFKNLGRKLVTAKPLGTQGSAVTPLVNQVIDPTDSVLGVHSRHPRRGLKDSYLLMIQSAFDPEWWQSPKLICVRNDNGQDVQPNPIVNTQAECDAIASSAGATGGTAYSQIEYNFSLFWGVSIMLYESTLKADETPVDKFFNAADLTLTKPTIAAADGVQTQFQGTLTAPVLLNSVTIEAGTQTAADDGSGVIVDELGVAIGTIDYASGKIDFTLASAPPLGTAILVGFEQVPQGILSPQALQGLVLFQTKGKCIGCHSGPEMTNASVNNVRNEPLERMHMHDNNIAVYDNGFYNIGVRPTSDDVGVGGTDPHGKPLAASAVCQQDLFLCSKLRFSPVPPIVPGRPNENIATAPLDPAERIAIMGNFKTPGLRNVELTAPYWHNGGILTLEEIVDFYDRGGDFPQTNEHDLDPNIQPIGFTPDEKAALVAFLKALTDERVRYQKAPFDHPQLFVPNGHPVDHTVVLETSAGSKVAKDDLIEIPAVGRKGSAAAMPTFKQGLSTP